MTRVVSRFPLLPMSLGIERYLTVHTYGEPDIRPKAYLQAGMHAGELPGVLTLHHLIRMLDAGEDELLGQITIIPVANPIGKSQIVLGTLHGRFGLQDGVNFNRDFPDLAAEVGDAVAGRLGPDADGNVAVIREALLDALALHASEAETEAEYLKLTLLRMSADADIALDLHCDDEAPKHVYMAQHTWPAGGDVAADLGMPVTLLADESGGNPFDESLSKPWLDLRTRFGADHPIPSACLSATVELRGMADVGDALAEEDAVRIYRLLQRRGIIAGDPGPLPKLERPALPLTGMEVVKAPLPGVLSYRVPLGTEVVAGQPIADLIDPTADDPGEGRIEIKAGIDGYLFTRRAHKFVWPGAIIAKIAGARPIERRTGRMLSD